MGRVPGLSRSSRQICLDVAVGVLGLVSIGATLSGFGLIIVVTYQAIVIYNPSLGGRPIEDFGIAGWAGLATSVGITGVTLATTLYCNRNQGDYKKIIGTSVTMIGLSLIAALALVVLEVFKA